MPAQLVETIEFHHDPENAPAHSHLAFVTQFADYLCKWRGIGYSGDSVIPQICESTVQLLNVRMKDDEIDSDYYIEMVDGELEKAETFINLIQGKQVPERTHIE